MRWFAAGRAGRTGGGDHLTPLRVLYFGTYERSYPRNAQVISCLRGAGVDVVERHEPVWENERGAWQAGARAMLRLARAEARLFRRPRERFDAVIVGYPGHLDLAAARRAVRSAPVVFNPLISLVDTLVGDRARFQPGSLPARLLEEVDRRALRAADLVVADTEAQADHLAKLAALDRGRVAVCYVGAEERLFMPGWAPAEPFRCLFVGKLIPLHGLETILAAAALAPELPFRVVGSGQEECLLDAAPPNVEHVPWVAYERLPAEFHGAGCALGVFGTSAKTSRVIPNKAFHALACGTPLITADTGGARELLVNEQNALLVPPGDPAALAAAARRLADDRALASRLSAEALRIFRERASERVLGLRWRGLIQQLLQ
jgi:glycosyltransferase involved in cell wall biosynthesis